MSKWQQEWGGKIYFSHGEFNLKGVAILIPKNLEEICDILTVKTDDEGRLIIIECKMENNIIVLMNLYCPTKDHINAQKNFLKTIKAEIENKGDKNLIIAGDLNTYLNPTLDKKGDRIETQSSFSLKLNELCEEYMLHVHIWRVRNPNSKIFTRRQKCKNGLVQSRLDYFLTSIGISYLIKKSEIKPGNCSDQSIISITLDLLDTPKRGRSYWKFNNDLLNDPEYVNMVKNIINDIKTNVNMENKNSKWEFTKCKI